MSVIRVGSSSPYANGWDAIFGAGKARARKKPVKKAKKASSSKAAKAKGGGRAKKASKRR